MHIGVESPLHSRIFILYQQPAVVASCHLLPHSLPLGPAPPCHSRPTGAEAERNKKTEPDEMKNKCGILPVLRELEIVLEPERSVPTLSLHSQMVS